MQRKPRLSGLSGSPLTRSSRPSDTSTSIPQKVGWQFMGHMVRTVVGGMTKSYLSVASGARLLLVWEERTYRERGALNEEVPVDGAGTDARAAHRPAGDGPADHPSSRRRVRH